MYFKLVKEMGDFRIEVILCGCFGNLYYVLNEYEIVIICIFLVVC